MNYDELIAKLEEGVDYSTLEPMPAQEVLKSRLLAMRQLAALHEREARRLSHESEQLDNLLMAL
jgi:hypothetical protein